jgi:hypothetical protein
MVHDVAGKWIGYGEGDNSPEVTKIEHRMLYAYPKSSQAVKNGVIEDTVFNAATARSVSSLATFINENPPLSLKMAKGKPLRTDGIADLAFRQAIGAYVAPVIGKRYPIQGVWADSRAFLNPPEAHSFNRATNDFAAEGYRLYSNMVGLPIIPVGYSMGGTSVKKFLDRLPPQWRQYVKMVITFGDPCMPDSGSMLGNDPGEGISKDPQPQWVRDRYYSFSIEGDWYPRARGLLFFMYQILTRAELTPEFAMWLFTSFPILAFQQLMGQKPSDDPLAGVLGGLASLMTTGPVGMIGSLLNPLQLFQLLPQLINLLFDAIKFITTNAHGKYDDPAYALWDGQTAVNKAVQLVREVVPNGATLVLFPGTWSSWNQLFQFDVAARLQ